MKKTITRKVVRSADKKQVTKPVARKVTPASEVAELNVERMKLTRLKPHPKNPRTHPKPNSPEWEVLRKSLDHDYFDPVVFNKRNGQLVSGHLRTKVLKTMGIKEADVVVVDYDEPTHLARMVAANKSIGENDMVKLSEVFHELGAITDFDLALSGFTLSEVPGYASDEEHDHSSPESTAAADERIAYLLDALGSPAYEVVAGGVYVIGGSIVVLCALPNESMGEELVRWLTLTDTKARAVITDKKVAKLPCRLAIGPEGFLLVDNVLPRWAPDVRWVVVCPTTLSAQTLLSIYSTNYGRKASIVKVTAL